MTRPEIGDSEQTWLDISTVPRLARPFVSATPEILASRVLLLERLYKAGTLSEEVRKLGLKNSWLDQLRKEPIRVVISEQQQPLSSLFCAIGDYGSPSALPQSLRAMSLVASILEQRAEQGNVDIGFLVSRYHGASFKGISFGGYITVPDGTDFKKLYFFTKKERERFGTAGYGDLEVSKKQVASVISELTKRVHDKKLEVDRHSAAMAKQDLFNAALEQKGATPSHEQYYRAEQNRQKLMLSKVELHTLAALRDDIDRAFEESTNSHKQASYIEFVARLNEYLARRVGEQRPFETFYNDTIDLLPSGGVAHWPTLVQAVLKAGILSRNDCLVRYRTTLETGKVVYMNGRLDEVTQGAVWVKTSTPQGGAHERWNLDELSERSANLVAQGKPPLIVPCAEFRYLFNLGYSRSAIFYDGFPYCRIRRIIDALQDDSFVLAPREPKLHAYSDLWAHEPRDSEAPWDCLVVKHASHEYYGSPRSS